MDKMILFNTVFNRRHTFYHFSPSSLSASIEMQFERLGVDPLFPGSGEVYKCNGYYLNHEHGGIVNREWLDNNFEANADDIYVASFPKTGTTWAQELVYVIGNDINFEKAQALPMYLRFPYIESRVFTKDPAKAYLLKPRYIKTHYPYSLLPQSIVEKKCKIVYTIRNPKDTLVSFYHFATTNKFFDYQGDFPTFFKIFMEERVVYSPFSKHILEYWRLRNQDNILILMYEDMKKDLASSVRSIASFLGKNLNDDQVRLVVEHCSFENMKKNPSTNYLKGFMRKGKVGDWRNHFTEEMSQQMDDYVQRHFEGTGLKFKFDL